MMTWPLIVMLRMEQRTWVRNAFWRQNLLDSVICFIFIFQGKRQSESHTGDSQVSTRECGNKPTDRRYGIWETRAQFRGLANEYLWNPYAYHTERAICPDWSLLHRMQE